MFRLQSVFGRLKAIHGLGDEQQQQLLLSLQVEGMAELIINELFNPEELVHRKSCGHSPLVFHEEAARKLVDVYHQIEDHISFISGDLKLTDMYSWIFDELFVLPVQLAQEILKNPARLAILCANKEQMLQWYKTKTDVMIMQSLPGNQVRKKRGLAYVIPSMLENSRRFISNYPLFMREYGRIFMECSLQESQCNATIQTRIIKRTFCL